MVTRKGKKGPIPPRIFMRFAREAPIAAIFRRGPSDWTQLLRWNTVDDTLERGQWFHGRIYERRSDISPDGSLLIYFVRKISGRTLKDTEYTYAWTAISKPPFLTALALWPKGDCWHGGGSFSDNKTVVLNHKREVSSPHPNHEPQGLRIKLRKNVCGEDDPIYSERLQRDGWILKKKWETENRGYPRMFRTTQAEVREKRQPKGTQAIQLTRSITGLDYAEEFAVLDAKAFSIQLVEASWADWDQQGRLTFARGGRIFEGHIDADGSLGERELFDLNVDKPTRSVSPEWAQRW
jgi:hypothetical protein